MVNSAEQGKVISQAKVMDSASGRVIQAGIFNMKPLGVLTINMPSVRLGQFTTRRRLR
jgi:hypothetical protein